MGRESADVTNVAVVALWILFIGCFVTVLVSRVTSLISLPGRIRRLTVDIKQWREEWKQKYPR